MTTLPAVVRIVDLPAYTTVTGGELVEAVQTVGGVAISVQIPFTAIMTTTLGGLPTGGGTGQILNKLDSSNYSAQWSNITQFVAVGTSLATTGSATSIVAYVPNSGITSTQIANNAVGTNQLASSLGIASSLSIGTILTVTGTSIFNGTAIFNSSAIFNGTTVFANGLNVTGTTLITGTFGVVGTSQFTGAFNVVGTSIVTGNLGVIGTTLFTSGAFGIVGTSLLTGAVGIVGTTLHTGAFGVVGTSQLTGIVNIVGTTFITGTLGNVGTATFTANAFNVIGTTSFTSGAFNVNGTTLFTSGAFGVVGTTLVTGRVGIVGTTIVTGFLGVSGAIENNRNSAAPPAFSGGIDAIHLTASGNNAAAFWGDSFGTNNYFVLRRANGTSGGQTSLIGGNQIGIITGHGYANGAYASDKVFISFNAFGNWTTGDTSAQIQFNTTPLGTSTSFEAVRIQASGGVSIGTITDPGIGKLMVSSGIVVNSYTAGVIVSSSTGVLTATTSVGVTLLNTLTANSVASVNDVTSFTNAYSNYRITLENVVPATNNAILQMTVATTGSAFIAGNYNSMAMIDSSAIVSDTSTSVILLSGTRATTTVGNGTAYGVNGFITVYNPASANFRKNFIAQLSYLNGTTNATTAYCIINAGGWQDINNAITGINFAFNSGNIQTGTIRIYGIP